MVLDWKQQKAEKKALFDEFTHAASNDVDSTQVAGEAEKIVDSIIGKTEKGIKENEDLESLKESCVEDFKKITTLYDEKLDIEKVCTYIENMAKQMRHKRLFKELLLL